MSALAIQKNKRVYTNMPLIHFYGDHFEFVGEALGKDKKSYGEVFFPFLMQTAKPSKAKSMLSCSIDAEKPKMWSRFPERISLLA